VVDCGSAKVIALVVGIGVNVSAPPQFFDDVVDARQDSCSKPLPGALNQLLYESTERHDGVVAPNDTCFSSSVLRDAILNCYFNKYLPLSLDDERISRVRSIQKTLSVDIKDDEFQIPIESDNTF
jgi:biotin-(acetyl-CoA carboxylase) ligase